MREKLRLQYAVNVAATAVGFGLGGVFYSYTGVRGVCTFGAALEGLELLSTSLFYYLATLERRIQLKGKGQLEGGDEPLGKGTKEVAGSSAKEEPHQQMGYAPNDASSAFPACPSGRIHSLFRPLSASPFVRDFSKSNLSRAWPYPSSSSRSPNLAASGEIAKQAQ